MSYRLFEHTADVGLEVEAGSVNELFEEAARGFFSLAVEDASCIQTKREVNISLSSENFESLLVDWLSDLIFRLDAEKLLLKDFRVDIRKSDAISLEAKAWGETVDLEHHELRKDIKAVTYHDLKLEQTPKGWSARVLFDI